MNHARLVDFFYEAGMLRHTPRSGYQFLGSGRESVAEHSHRTAVIGYALARLAGADPARTVLICLFHDLGEARTGDHNYVNKRYSQVFERQAIEDALCGTPFAELLELYDAHSQGAAPDAPLEARLAHDADQLDLLLNLKRELDIGNAQASRWMESVAQRLVTPLAQELAEEIRTRPHDQWWAAAVVTCQNNDVPDDKNITD